MPIQHAIWTVGHEPKPLTTSRLPREEMLEDMILRDSRILTSEWMLIGRREVTSFGGRIDLLAIAPDGSLVLIELKRDRTPREIIAQALDCASWVDQLRAQRTRDSGHLVIARKRATTEAPKRRSASVLASKLVTGQ